MRKVHRLKTAIDSLRTRGRAARLRRRRSVIEGLESRAMLAVGNEMGNLGTVFYIDMENHDFDEPDEAGGLESILDNPAAPYLNSLVTPNNPNSAQSSYASNYTNVFQDNKPVHPSEPNYVWQEAGIAGPLNDNDPFPSNIVNSPNLSSLLQNAGILWKSYQEDIDLSKNASNQLTNTPLPQNQWVVPLQSVIGSSPAYTNPYNHSNLYGFAAKHDGQLFFTATNGGNDTTPANPEASHYAPLQQLQIDLNNNTVGRYNLITPNLYNDMHNGLPDGFTYHGTKFTGDQAAIAEGDNFLSQIIPMIQASQAYKNNGAIVIWFDETEGGNTEEFTLPEIVLSPLAKGNAYNSTLPYTHSSDLKSMQELFNVQAPGGGFLGDANSPGINDLADLFKSDINGTGSTVAATAGANFSGTVAKFTDVDGNQNAGEYTATIDWGDGTGTSAGTVNSAATGFSITGSHLYATKGIYTLTVTINDTDGATAKLNAEVLDEPNALYVAAVYQDVLGRAADGGGLEFWTHQLDKGAPISSVAAQIGHSAEYYGSFVIKPAYHNLLHRDADAAGLQYWTNQMLHGLTDQQLEAGFIAADEFFNNAGGTDLTWVDAVYQLLLGRTADQSGETFWTGQLTDLEKTESAVLARSQVAVRISSSQENNTNLINDDYQHYLGRAADAGGLQFWLQQFAAGKTNEDVIAGFTGSAEYYKNKTGVNP